MFGPLKKAYYGQVNTFMRNHVGQVVSRYNICRIISKAYLLSMTPSNAVNAFNKSGIFPCNPLVISDSDIAPSTVTNGRQKVNVSDGDEVLNVIPIGTGVLNGTPTGTGKHSSVSPCEVSENKTVGGFLNKRLPKFQPPFKKNKNQTVTLQGAITEEKLASEILAKEMHKSSNVKLASKKSHTQQRLQKNIKSPISGLSASILASSTTEPGPSGINNGQNQDDMSDGDSNDDICCICKQFVPPRNRVTYIRIGFRWIQCEVCEHWVHYTCFPGKIIREGFKCPHCNQKEE